MTIDDLLAEWNVWLPVFSSDVAKSVSGESAVLLEASPAPSSDAVPSLHRKPIPEQKDRMEPSLGGSPIVAYWLALKIRDLTSNGWVSTP